MTEGPIPAGLDATLVLVRHGESTWVAEGRFQGRADVPLSERGERQARLVAARLADPAASPALPIPAGPPLSCWHSPLARAATTARIIASRLDPPAVLVADARIAEIDQGEWQGLTRPEIRARDAETLAGWRREPARTHAPGGESLAEVADRVRSFLADVLAAVGRVDPEPTIEQALVPGYWAADRRDPWGIVVAHDGVFRVLLLEVLGLPLEAFWRFPFALCGITVVDIRNGRPTLRAHNLAEHLAPLVDGRADPSAVVDRQGAM